MAGMCPFFLSCWRGVSGVGLPARLAGGMCACGSMGCVGWCLKRAEGPTCFSAWGMAHVFRVSALQGQQEHKVCVSFALSEREFDVWLFPPGRLPWAEKLLPFQGVFGMPPARLGHAGAARWAFARCSMGGMRPVFALRGVFGMSPPRSGMCGGQSGH